MRPVTMATASRATRSPGTRGPRDGDWEVGCATATNEPGAGLALSVKAIVASGSPFPGTPQCNNVYIFPGVGLGVVAGGARRVTDRMMRAAAHRLATMTQGEQLFPAMHDIRTVSGHIAFAVARTAIDDGVADPCDDDALRRRIVEEMWEPRYIRYRPSASAMSREDLLREARDALPRT